MVRRAVSDRRHRALARCVQANEMVENLQLASYHELLQAPEGSLGAGLVDSVTAGRSMCTSIRTNPIEMLRFLLFVTEFM